MKILTPLAALLIIASAGCSQGEPPAGPAATAGPTAATQATATPIPETVVLPPTATPHPTNTPVPTPGPTPTGEPESTGEPPVMRRGEELTRRAAEAFDSGLKLAGGGMHDEALMKFLEAIRLQARTSGLLEYHAGLARAALGDHGEAVEHFGAAIRAKDGAELRVRRAVSARKDGGCGPAIRDAQTALGMPPEPETPGFNLAAEANLVLAMCQLDLGNTERALLHAGSAAQAALDAGYGDERILEIQELESRIKATIAAPTPEPAPEPQLEPTPTPAPELQPTPAPAPTPATPATPGVKLEDVPGMDWVRRHARESFDVIQGLHWIEDGLQEMEEAATRELAAMFARDGLGTEAGRIASMPFLKDFDLGEGEALRALRRLGREHPDILRNIMKWPPLTDEMAPIVAVMPGIAEQNPGLAGRILSPGATATETKRARLGNAREIRLNIVRLEGSGGDPGTMRHLEETASAIQGLMQEPFPAGSINVIFADAAGPDAGGVFLRTGIIIDPDEEGGEDGIRRVMAHEIAHHYWSGNAPWIDEGMAEYLATITGGRGRLERSWLGTPHYPCAEYRSIGEMPARERAHPCDYSLGVRLFLDISMEAGEWEFHEEMRNLYRLSLEERQQGKGLGIERMRERFQPLLHDEGLPHVHGGNALARWHDGDAAPRTDLFDDSAAEPDLEAMNGRIRKMEIVVDGRPASSFQSGKIHGSVVLRTEYGYEAGPEDATRNESVELELVLIHEDGMPILKPPLLIPVVEGNIGGRLDLVLGPALGQRWAAGGYTAYLYEGNRKLAETTWTVRP